MASSHHEMERLAAVNMSEQDRGVKYYAGIQNQASIDLVGLDQSSGVRQMNAITLVWTKPWLISAYILVWCISFANSLAQTIHWTLNSYIAVEFRNERLSNLSSVIATLSFSVIKLPLAKFIDLLGRPSGFALCFICVTISLIMTSMSYNVQTYIAAQIFFHSGTCGIEYILNIFLVDTSNLRNRLIWMALTASPQTITAFCGPPLAQFLLKHNSWRSGYEVLAKMIPGVCVPFYFIFYMMNRKAKKAEIIIKWKSEETFWQTSLNWCIKFGVISMFLISGGFALALLSFSTQGRLNHGFFTAFTVYTLIGGLFLIIVFVIWERFWASIKLFPYHMLTDRSVIAAYCLGFNIWLNYYGYKTFYSSYLQVVFKLSYLKSSFVANIYNIVSCSWQIISAIGFRYTETHRWVAIVATPIYLLMSGILINFRLPNSSINVLIMVEVVNAMCIANLLQVAQLAIMKAVPHEGLAMALALWAVVCAVGGSIGMTFSTAIWNTIGPKKLAEYLPDKSKADLNAIFNNPQIQSSLHWNSHEKQALVWAYTDAQKIMLITGLVTTVPCILWVAMIRNSRLSDVQVRRGLQA